MAILLPCTLACMSRFPVGASGQVRPNGRHPTIVKFNGFHTSSMCKMQPGLYEHLYALLNSYFVFARVIGK